jgi:hypothetical protein
MFPYIFLGALGVLLSNALNSQCFGALYCLKKFMSNLVLLEF